MKKVTPPRNSPCPCGSGKKYKKCCMLKASGIMNSPIQSSSNTTQSNDSGQLLFSKPFSSTLNKKTDQQNKSNRMHTQPNGNNTGLEQTQTIKLLDKSNAAEIIEKLGMDDLRFLNKLISDRIKVLNQSITENSLLRFTPGNRVQFHTKSGELITGTVIRINQKTVSVAVEGLEGWWKVSPQLLKHVKD